MNAAGTKGREAVKMLCGYTFADSRPLAGDVEGALIVIFRNIYALANIAEVAVADAETLGEGRAELPLINATIMQYGIDAIGTLSAIGAFIAENGVEASQ